MKYGWRERISGAVILIALAVIFVPLLFSEPAPRGERPQPVLSIERPIEVPRTDVPEPQPPEGLGQLDPPVSSGEQEPSETLDETAQRSAEQVAESGQQPPAEPAVDPIAELAQAAEQRQGQSDAAEASQSPSSPAPAASGEWAVQVGSFGEVANADRLLGQLREQGFPAYSRPRDNSLTTVYVGPYDSSEAGERAMNELKSRANLQGLLVRARN